VPLLPRAHACSVPPTRVQALLCAYVGALPHGSLCPEQLTLLAHAVRLAHLSPYFLAKVAPRVGWLCAAGRCATVQGLLFQRMGAPVYRGTPAAWLLDAPARAGTVDPAGRPVKWELSLAQLQPLVDRVAAGGSMDEVHLPSTTAAFGLGWDLMLQVAAPPGRAPCSYGCACGRASSTCPRPRPSLHRRSGGWAARAIVCTAAGLGC
jgi:hypothetical protein